MAQLLGRRDFFKVTLIKKFFLYKIFTSTITSCTFDGDHSEIINWLNIESMKIKKFALKRLLK